MCHLIISRSLHSEGDADFFDYRTVDENERYDVSLFSFVPRPPLCFGQELLFFERERKHGCPSSNRSTRSVDTCAYMHTADVRLPHIAM